MLGFCGIDRKSLGSHKVTSGLTVLMTSVDALNLTDLDLLQLDIEGYEWHALMGARETIARCRPVIQVELREALLNRYGHPEADVRGVLTELGYKEVSRQQGSDVVFM